MKCRNFTEKFEGIVCIEFIFWNLVFKRSGDDRLARQQISGELKLQTVK